MRRYLGYTGTMDDDLEKRLREAGGLEGLASQLGQYDPNAHLFEVQMSECKHSRMVSGRTDNPTIRDGTVIMFDEAVSDLSSSDAVIIQSSDGTDLQDLKMANEQGEPPRMYDAKSRRYYQVEQVNERTWRLRSEPHK